MVPTGGGFPRVLERPTLNIGDDDGSQEPHNGAGADDKQTSSEILGSKDDVEEGHYAEFGDGRAKAIQVFVDNSVLYTTCQHSFESLGGIAIMI